VDFVVGKKIVRIKPTSRVRQGDLLSTTIYNLAAEPIIRGAKSFENYEYPIFSRLFKITAYVDDIEVLPSSAGELQIRVDHILSVATDLALRFNPEKCKSLILINGKPHTANIMIEGKPIHCLRLEEQETYLGTPIGAKLRFRPPSELVSNLDKLAESHF